MATTVHSNLVIRDEQYSAGFIESVAQNTNAFNAASNGAIRLSINEEEGYYRKTRFFDTLSSIISRRDQTSTAAATGQQATTDEIVGVKCLRTAGPVDVTEGSFQTSGVSIDEFWFWLGQEVGKYTIKDYLNAGLNSVEAFLSGESALCLDYTGTGNLAFAALRQGLAKMGDAADRVVCWVMHSKPFFDLVGDGITNYKIENVAGALIVSGENSPISMGRPIVVTDSAALLLDQTTDNYYTLGLQAGAVNVFESERSRAVAYYLDRAQITRRFHGEHAFTLEVKGAEYDESNGGANPTDATLATASNWDAVVADKRDKAGVRIATT